MVYGKIYSRYIEIEMRGVIYLGFGWWFGNCRVWKVGSNGEPVSYAGVKLPRNSNLPIFAYTISLPFRSASFQRVATVAKQNRTLVYFFVFILFWCCHPTRAMASSIPRFLDHIQRCTTIGKVPLGEWSAGRWDLYLTTHNSYGRQTSMPPAGFKTTISARKRPKN